MYSALFYYEYSDRTPLLWDIYISKNAFSGKFKVDYPRIKPYFVLPEKLAYGVTTIVIDDCSLKIFDRDRLICECLKNESKMDKEIFNKAIQKYINDSKKNIGNLIDYCKKRKATNQMKSKIGVWL